MISAKASDLLTLHDKLATRAALGPVDAIASSASQLFDVVAQSTTCEYDFDLKMMWSGVSRWNKLVRQYVDPEAYESWMDAVTFSLQRSQGHSFMRTNTVAGRSGQRQWGSCMVGMGFRRVGRKADKPSLILHSRTTYLGYIGMMDLALAHVIARDIGERNGLGLDDISFVWNIESAQLHAYRSMAWWFQDDQRSELLTSLDPPDTGYRDGLKLARREFAALIRKDNEGELYGDGSFVSRTRLRKHYHTEVCGPSYGEQFEGGTRYGGSTRKRAKPLPSAPVSSLTFPATKRTIQEGSSAGGMVWDIDTIEKEKAS